MALIPLSRGKHALVDDADVPLLSGYAWRAEAPSPKLPESFYAMARINGRTAYMHRLLLLPSAGQQVDHVDGNGLNNCRANLRLCTQSQNNVNKKIRVGKSGYRGVFATRSGRFQAAIQFNRKAFHLGTFSTAEEAARAYDKAVVAKWGEFARPNFPEQANAA